MGDKKRTFITAAVVLVIIFTTIMVLVSERDVELVAVPDTLELNSATKGGVEILPDTTTTPDADTDRSWSVKENPPVMEDTAVENDEIQRLLSQAETSISELRLTTPRGNNAYELYQQVLALDPDNELAKAGIRTISDKYIALAYGAIEANNTDRAKSYINKAAEIWPESDKIKPVNEAMQAKVKELSTQEEQENSTAAEYAAPVEDHSQEQMSTVEKNKDENTDRKEGTGDQFIRSIGGGK